jgi:hypothetical protein
VADPVAVSRAWALRILLDTVDRSGDEPATAPKWVRENVPWLARFWGDGLRRASRLAINQATLDWSRSDPDGLLEAARHIAAKKPVSENNDAQRLMEICTAETNPSGPKVRHYFIEQLLRVRPEALVEAVQILNTHRDDVVRVMSRYGYSDPPTIGGYLDRELPNPNISARALQSTRGRTGLILVCPSFLSQATPVVFSLVSADTLEVPRRKFQANRTASARANRSTPKACQ